MGLGGTGNNGLMQTGIANDGSESNTYGWWQMIAADGSTPGIMDLSVGTISTGDNVREEVVWEGTYVAFWVTDTTTGNDDNWYSDSTYSGLPISSYYDPTTADYINERETVGGSYEDLRRFSGFSWLNMTTYNNNNNYSTDAGNFPWFYVDMYGVLDSNNPPSTNNLLAYVNGGGMSDTSSFSDVWNQCEG
ncbi:MAG: hypothetical protein ACYDCC_14155 [Actinomycetota bacterium]